MGTANTKAVNNVESTDFLHAFTAATALSNTVNETLASVEEDIETDSDQDIEITIGTNKCTVCYKYVQVDQFKKASKGCAHEAKVCTGVCGNSYFKKYNLVR